MKNQRKPRIQLWAEKRNIHEIISSDEFIFGLTVGFFTTSTAVITIMAIIKFVN